jgi:hypothetical protein
MARALQIGLLTNQRNPMKNETYSVEGFESTYALLVRSEEKERSIFEGAVYFAVILSAILSLWHAVTQPILVPTAIHTTSISRSANTTQRA